MLTHIALVMAGAALGVLVAALCVAAARGDGQKR